MEYTKNRELFGIILDCFSYVDKKDNTRKVIIKWATKKGENILFFNSYEEFEKSYGVPYEDFNNFSKSIFGKKLQVYITETYQILD